MTWLGSTSADSLVAALIFIYIAFKLITRNFDYWNRRGVPYIKPIPIFGNFYEAAVYKTDIGECLRKLYKSIEEPYFGIWVLNTPHFVIKNPELVKTVLVKDFNNFYDRTIASDEKADPIAANLLFMMKNPEWKAMRNKITPMFTSGKMKSMIPLIENVGNSLAEYISKYCVGKPSVECKELCAKYTTEVLVTTAFGIDGNSFDYQNSEFRNVGRKMFDFTLWRAIKTFCYFFSHSAVSIFKMTFFEKDVSAFLTNVFWETIRQREESQTKRNDLIDVIIELKNQKDDGHDFVGNKVVAQAVQFFAAGFETTSSTMAFTLYELCLNSDIQNKLRSEIRDYQKNPGGINYENIQSMKYLHMVVSETLRKYPVLPFLDRRCIQDYKLPGTNVILEKGTPVYIPMIGLHMDDKYFPEPDTYDPERFSEERIKSIPPYTYIPFGEGPHNCIGARFGLLVTKLGLVKILSDFRVERNLQTPIPVEFEPKSFIMQSKVGLPMTFHRLS